MRRLVVLSGLPGCGKSTYATAIDGHHVAIDTCWGALGGFAVDRIADAYSMFEGDIYAAKASTVVAESTALTVKRRGWFMRFRGAFERIECHWWAPRFDESWMRRSHLPWEEVRAMAQSWEAPRECEGFDLLVRVL